MNIIYAARKIELSDNFKNKSSLKLSKLNRFFGDDTTVYITVSVLRENVIVEITVKYNDMIFRAEKSAVDKYEALDNSIDTIISVYITVSVLRENVIVEITVKYNDMIFRAEKSAVDKYEALDNSIDTIIRQIRKNKTKLEKKIHSSISDDLGNYDDIQEEVHKVVKYKRFDVKPMDVEEAILQMELLGHEFFMFRNSENNEINVVYKRKDNNYAVLESE